MKLDYNFIKQILITMEEYEKHEISLYPLLKKLKVMSIDNKLDEALVDKFLGHIKILGDGYYIECSNDEYGFMQTCGGYAIANADFRLTAQGYEFLEILKNDTAFNKVKGFALNTALDIGKQIIVKLATGGM